MPIISTPPSLSIQAMIERVEKEQDLVLEAIWKGDEELLFQAFILDPLVDLSVDEAHDLFTRMMDACYLRY